jgi:hypothetical protein
VANIPEVSRYNCWLAERLIPPESSAGCLRNEIDEFNEKIQTGEINPNSLVMLALFNFRGGQGEKLKCRKGGCPAEVPITPELELDLETAYGSLFKRRET